ncbi:MAG: DNA-directed RNA polymerase subunit D [Candidatus Nanoarchaeia archaeon]|nr:DNA-directed RNA polymerase subunit D [Candidatus Nanoarchaeia archaeon]
MKINVIEKHKDKITAVIEDASNYLINAVRRTIMTRVPVMAIEDINVMRNTSILYNEIIALRLGLIPLTTDLKSYVFRNECKCKGEGCARCEVKLQLKAKGPCTVYAKDLISTDPAVKPAHEDMIIAKLTLGQELELEAVAVLGVGKEHTKWAPGIAYTKDYPKITIKDPKAKCWEKAAEACPVDVFYKTTKDSLQINKDNLLKCHLCKACEEACPSAVSVDSEKDKYFFTVESWGQLKPSEIIEKAVELLETDIKDVEKQVK